MPRAVLSLGSNLGDRLAHLRRAITVLGDAVVAVSPVYHTPPWGDPDQPEYLNAVVVAQSELADPLDWLRLARAAERAAGRRRDPARRFGPRSLDVDVIAGYAADGGMIISDDPQLILPHPRAHQRAFVLRPWFDLDPAATLPGHGPVRDLLGGVELAGDLRAGRPGPGRPVETMPGGTTLDRPQPIRPVAASEGNGYR